MVPSNPIRQPSLGQHFTYNITSSIPGRVRVQLGCRPGRHERLVRWADWLQTESFFQHIKVSADSGSLILHYNAKIHTAEQVQTFLLETAQKAKREKAPKLRHLHGADNALIPTRIIEKHDSHASFVKTIKAKDIHDSSPLHLLHMVAPTVAVVLASIEIVPAAIAVIAIAYSISPTAKKAINDARLRRFTVDELDLLNVTLAVVDGSLFPAAAISWLVNLSELMRERALSKTRAKHATARTLSLKKWSVEQRASTKLLLENALLTDTQFQGITTRFHLNATVPFAGAAGAISILTQDIGFIVGVLKPLYDFAGALRFGVPTILLNTMTQTVHHGPVFRSGRAVEKLAKVDSMVFFTTDGLNNRRIFDKRIKQFIKRGIHHFLMPTSEEAERVETIAQSMGMNYVMAEQIPPNPAHAVGILHRHGHVIATIEDGSQAEEWLHRSDVRISTTGNLAESRSVDIIMKHQDLKGAGHSIDLARHSMKLAQQNLMVSGIAAGINLSLVFIPPLAASVVSTISTGILSANVSRELAYNQEEDAGPDFFESETPEARDAKTVR